MKEKNERVPQLLSGQLFYKSTYTFYNYESLFLKIETYKKLLIYIVDLHTLNVTK